MNQGSTPLKQIRVLVVDDHPLMRDGIVSMIDSEPDMTVVAQASNGLEAIECFERHRPDVTLMDLQMAKMDGVTAIEAICRAHPGARILVLTTYKGDVQALRALNAGASGYLLKSMIRKELVDALRKAPLGRRQIVPEVAAEIGLHALDEPLSSREIEVLRQVSAGRANKQVAAQLDLSEETVKTHMRNILAKLKARDRTHAVMIALDRGIISGWDRS
ncbi:response regulator transcription factor [Steroidobacter sp. S1-65]|uniref:Response regulator transcription factor n=1 Tax=Steroidobacter gossypii TaxID=2805490 RepID=A0ABS1X5P0_9GAMM|nr:response regulator transcription factor [Steroidobacter gossypii]MBM0108542.1 response regulator transcription factor [Steroidobacter gossypii]